MNVTSEYGFSDGGMSIHRLPQEDNVSGAARGSERTYTVETPFDGTKRFALRAQRLTPKTNPTQRAWFDLHVEGQPNRWYKVLIERRLRGKGVFAEATVYSPDYVDAIRRSHWLHNDEETK